MDSLSLRVLQKLLRKLLQVAIGKVRKERWKLLNLFVFDI